MLVLLKELLSGSDDKDRRYCCIPTSTSCTLISLLINIVDKPPRNTSKTTVATFNLSQLKAWRTPKDMTVFVASGNLHLVTEIVEQLGWLMCALKTSTQLRGYCPVLREASITQRAKTPQGIMPVRCSLYVESTTDEILDTPSAGRCWCPLFAKRSMVTGYPILRRPVPNTGLELSLRAMSSLINASQVSQLGTRILMKGYNSPLNARRVLPGLVLWHLAFTDHEDERISYDDPRVVAMEGEDLGGLRQLESARHIVGWCEKAIDLCSKYLRLVRSAYKPRIP